MKVRVLALATASIPGVIMPSPAAEIGDSAASGLAARLLTLDGVKESLPHGRRTIALTGDTALAAGGVGRAPDTRGGEVIAPDAILAPVADVAVGVADRRRRSARGLAPRYPAHGAGAQCPPI